MDSKDRLLLFIDHLKVNNKAFEESVGASNGYINSMRKGVGLKMLEQIRAKYPQLNIEWLIKGEGEMLINEKNIVEEPKTTYKIRSEVDRAWELVDYFKKENEILSEKNAILTASLEKLTNQLETQKKDARNASDADAKSLVG